MMQHTRDRPEIAVPPRQAGESKDTYYARLLSGGLSINAVATATGVKPDTVRRNAQRASGIRRISTKPQTDAEKWKQAKRNLPTVFKLAFPTDIHVPDHDPYALELACKVMQAYKPDVCVAGSDVFDFESISSFDSDPADVVQDVWQKADDAYQAVMRQIVSATPSAVRPFIVGNHDIRVWRFMTKHAPQFRHTLLNGVIVPALQKSGALWLGLDNEFMRITDYFVVRHGKRASTYVSRANGEELGWQAHVLSGHKHHFQAYSHSGMGRPHISVSAPCLCSLNPTYAKTKVPRNWQQGIVLATVDQRRETVHFEPVIFDKGQAIWGGNLFQVKRKVYR